MMEANCCSGHIGKMSKPERCQRPDKQCGVHYGLNQENILLLTVFLGASVNNKMSSKNEGYSLFTEQDPSQHRVSRGNKVKVSQK